MLELNPDCFQEEPVPSTTTTEGSGDTSTSTTDGSGYTSTSTTESSGDTSTTTTDKPDDGGDSGALGLTVSKLLLLSSALLYAMR
jgi:hypothetical protein